MTHLDRTEQRSPVWLGVAKMALLVVGILFSLYWTRGTKGHPSEQHLLYLPLISTPPELIYDDLYANAADVRAVALWNHSNLTYYFQNISSDLSSFSQREAVKNAFQLWADVTPLSFTEVSTSSSADIIILWGAGEHGDSVPFDGQWKVLAHAYYPLDGDIHFDEDEYWTNQLPIPNGGIDLVTVAAHEIGHALGLDHTDVSGALMFPIYTTDHRYLHEDDIQGIQSLYGASTPNIAVTSVEVTGSIKGVVHTKYVFGATTSPDNATGPIYYTWSPTPINGQGTARATYEWTTEGAKQISVSASNSYGTASTNHTVYINNEAWLIDFANNDFGSWNASYSGYGNSTTHPVPADYDGDGRADLSVKTDDGRWLIDFASSGFGRWNVSYSSYGSSTAHPVPADYDGDGRADLSVKTDDGRWLIDFAVNGFGRWNEAFSQYGGQDAEPVPADYDGDGTVDLSIKKK